MSETPQPNWYPDPSGEAGLRWWDGTQWTEYTHTDPAQQPLSALGTVPETPARGRNETPDAPRRRKKTWVLLTAGIAALALVTTAAIAIPAFLGRDSASQVEPVIANGYKYLAPIELDMSQDDPAVTLKASVDLDELRDRLLDEGEPISYNTGVIDLYADRELTVPVQTFVFSSDARNGFEWDIRPLQAVDYASKASDIYDDSLEYDTVVYDRELPWSQYAEYWIKRTYDGDGKKLEFPEVTQVIPKFDTKRPDPVRVTFSKGAEDGSVKINWTAPEYADKHTEYLIVKSSPSSFATSDDEEWQTSLIGIVKGDTSYDTTDHRPFAMNQNAGLSLYSGDSADVQEFGGEGIWKSRMNTSKSRIGVIVKHDGQYSPLDPVAPDSSVRAQPSEIATFQQFQTRDESQKWNVGDLTGLETWMPVTTLDGATRSMQVQIDPTSLNPDIVIQNFGENGGFVYPDGIGMTGTILGTSLTTKYASYVPAGMSKAEWMEQLPAHIEAFNARSLADQSKTGGVLLTVEDADHSIDFAEYRQYKAVKETPKTEFPVFGTHPMVEHIAANMIAGEPAIDVSKWRDQPGAPSPYDAYREAMTQNPLINYGRPIVEFDGNKVYVDYVFDQGTREDAMRISYDSAKKVAATVEGKSDEEKAIAINQWVIDQTEYDYESLAAYEGNSLVGLSMPMGRIAYDSEFTAWSPLGVFRDGKAVCMGYAQAFTMIAREAGLDSIIVSGEVIDGGPHAWNRVSIDGTWKSLDPTWNDSASEQNRYLIINEDDYTGAALRTADATDNWILESNKSKYDTP